MEKRKVVVVTDSTCNLPEDIVEEYGIPVIPQILNWDGQSLRDGVDISPEAFYERLAASETIPTTSQASAGEFLEFFRQAAETAESIVAILISDELSGTLDSARTAAGMLPDLSIEIVDSRSASLGLGLIVLAAARAAQEGMDHAEVAQLARDMVPRMRVMFVVDTLEYLHKGGRIGGASRLIGSMLSLKPVLHLHDGRIEPLARIRTKRKAIRHLLDVAADDVKGVENLRGGVLSASSSKDAQAIVDEISQRMRPVELIQNELTPVIGTHVGPGTVGFAYLLN
jgi:DegV family protein with EDD domain